MEKEDNRVNKYSIQKEFEELAHLRSDIIFFFSEDIDKMHKVIIDYIPNEKFEMVAVFIQNMYQAFYLLDQQIHKLFSRMRGITALNPDAFTHFYEPNAEAINNVIDSGERLVDNAFALIEELSQEQKNDLKDRIAKIQKKKDYDPLIYTFGRIKVWISESRKTIFGFKECTPDETFKPIEWAAIFQLAKDAGYFISFNLEKDKIERFIKFHEINFSVPTFKSRISEYRKIEDRSEEKKEDILFRIKPFLTKFYPKASTDF